MNENCPDLSSCLFKYGTVNYLKHTLEECTLKFSDLTAFNDIYENDYRLVHYFNDKNSLAEFGSGQHNPIGNVRDLIDEQLSKYRATCFSRKANISLMWSHYAGHHKGVCYCFKAEQPNDIFVPRKSILWGNIVYSSRLPTVTVFQEHTRKNMLDELATQVLLTKPLEWAYEEEVRCWSDEPVDTVEFAPENLRAIIVGRRMPDDKIEEIEAHIKKFNKDNNQSIKTWFACREPSSYNLSVHDNKDLRNAYEKTIVVDTPLLPKGDDSPLTCEIGDV